MTEQNSVYLASCDLYNANMAKYLNKQNCEGYESVVANFTDVDGLITLKNGTIVIAESKNEHSVIGLDSLNHPTLIELANKTEWPWFLSTWKDEDAVLTPGLIGTEKRITMMTSNAVVPLLNQRIVNCSEPSFKGKPVYEFLYYLNNN